VVFWRELAASMRNTLRRPYGEANPFASKSVRGVEGHGMQKNICDMYR
jgi:hypothetical protein